MRTDIDRLPPLDLLLAFEAAARHLSFTRAAAERSVTQSAVSRQIRALEDDLGVALFARQHRALVLTPAGEKLLLACQNMLAQLRRTVASIRAPVLLLAPAAFAPDETTRQAVLQRYQGQISAVSRARVVLATRARHFVMLDDPDFWFSQLDAFVREAAVGD